MADDAKAPPPGSTITELARAKVNLTLRVLGRRPDGYHQLESLVMFADIGDDVTLEVGAVPAVETSGRFGTDIVGPNLAAEMLRRLAHAEPRLQLGRVMIEKHLPVAAGLGGGSADAAATLRAVRRANPAFEESFDWHGLAAGLGADVPVCYADMPAMMWGFGDRIRELNGFPALAAVLANPGVPVSPDKTSQVFRQLKAFSLQSNEPPDPQVPSRFTSPDDFIAYLATMANDLAVPARALMPACIEVEAELATCRGCRLVRMSGAGPTVFGLFGSLEAARLAAETLSRSHPRWWVRPVVLS